MPALQHVGRLAAVVAGALLASGCVTVLEGTPSPSPVAATPCPVLEETGALLSDRLVDVRIESDATADRIVFILGERSTAPTDPNGRLMAVSPPFFAGASGIEVKVAGGRFVEIRMTGMLLVDETGTPAYDGPGEFAPELSVLKALVSVDQFEGHSAWIAGYVGSGCVSLDASGPGSFVVSFAH